MPQTKILVADDSRTIRVQLQQLLREAGYEVSLAHDGREALDLARSEHPQLVIMDIQMPEMDGYEACDRIMQLPDADPNLRFIFFTIDRGCHLEQLGRQFGAYLQKPLDGDVMIQVIRNLSDPGAASEATLSLASV